VSQKRKRKGHNYERMCLGCRQLRNKSNLMRIVALWDGRIIIDETKKLCGRGAYVCPITDCAIAMFKKRTITYGLKRPINGEKINELLSQLKRHILWMSGDLIRLW